MFILHTIASVILLKLFDHVTLLLKPHKVRVLRIPCLIWHPPPRPHLCYCSASLTAQTSWPPRCSSHTLSMLLPQVFALAVPPSLDTRPLDSHMVNSFTFFKASAFLSETHSDPPDALVNVLQFSWSSLMWSTPPPPRYLILPNALFNYLTEYISCLLFVFPHSNVSSVWAGVFVLFVHWCIQGTQNSAWPIFGPQ